MSDRFLPNDPVASKDQIVEELYERLTSIKMYLQNPCKDGFDQGVNFEMNQERRWLENLLDLIERS